MNGIENEIRALIFEVFKDGIEIIVDKRREDGWLDFRIRLFLNDEEISSDSFCFKEPL